jgi:hypothetical protein
MHRHATHHARQYGPGVTDNGFQRQRWGVATICGSMKAFSPERHRGRRQGAEPRRNDVHHDDTTTRRTIAREAAKIDMI